MGAERLWNGFGCSRHSAVCLPERLLFWTPSIEETNCIIHGGQAGNGKNE